MHQVGDRTWDVNGHVITVADNGAIGDCDCADFKMRKSAHQGWCKHRLAVLLVTEEEGDDNVISLILALNSRLRKAVQIVAEGGARDRSDSGCAVPAGCSRN